MIPTSGLEHNVRTAYVLVDNLYVHRTYVKLGKSTIAAKKTKTTLSRQKVIDEAIRFSNKNGLDALSMRSLAGELNAGVMSLYNHVQDKNDLIDAMVERVCQDIECPKGDGQWKQELRICVSSAYEQMRKHRWLASVWNRPPGPEKNHYLEALLRIMNNAGFPEDLACRGFHALTMHVSGYSLQAQDMPFKTKSEFRAFAKQTLEKLEEENYPNLRQHVQYHLDGKDTASDFDYMVELILDGLEADLAGR